MLHPECGEVPSLDVYSLATRCARDVSIFAEKTTSPARKPRPELARRLADELTVTCDEPNARRLVSRAKLQGFYLAFTGNFAGFDFFAALLAGLAVGFASSRLSLMPDHTPVPCMESVAPTAYRAPSNAVFMVQKIGMV